MIGTGQLFRNVTKRYCATGNDIKTASYRLQMTTAKQTFATFRPCHHVAAMGLNPNLVMTVFHFYAASMYFTLYFFLLLFMGAVQYLPISPYID